MAKRETAAERVRREAETARREAKESLAAVKRAQSILTASVRGLRGAVDDLEKKLAEMMRKTSRENDGIETENGAETESEIE